MCVWYTRIENAINHNHGKSWVVVVVGGGGGHYSIFWLCDQGLEGGDEQQTPFTCDDFKSESSWALLSRPNDTLCGRIISHDWNGVVVGQLGWFKQSGVVGPQSICLSGLDIVFFLERFIARKIIYVIFNVPQDEIVKSKVSQPLEVKLCQEISFLQLEVKLIRKRNWFEFGVEVTSEIEKLNCQSGKIFF